jgi:pimeloyl-ACP methyl ester carboxylesterase
MRCYGEGSPVVVIDVGFGESYDSWQPIIDELARQARVCIYDRAGYRESETGPFPRTAGQAAHELVSLLQRGGVEPPTVLVGHSLGALHALLVAAWEPELLAGVVLVDPPPIGYISGRRFVSLKEMADRQTAELKQAAEQARRQGDTRQSSYLETLASEHEMVFSQSAEQIQLVPDLGELPLVVVAAGVPNPAFGDSAEAFQEFWIESNRELAKLSREGEFLLAADSGHHVHQDAPELVLRAIERFLSGAPEE